MNDDSLSELSVLSEDEDGELDAGSELAKPSLEELNAAMVSSKISAGLHALGPRLLYRLSAISHGT